MRAQQNRTIKEQENLIAKLEGELDALEQNITEEEVDLKNTTGKFYNLPLNL